MNLASRLAPVVRHLLAGGLLAAVVQAAGWEKRAPLPEPAGGFAAGAIQGRIVTLGGVTWRGDTKVWLDRIWSYDPAANTWTDQGRFEAPLGYPVIGYDRDAFWIAGGSSGPASHRALWRIDASRRPRRVAELDRPFVIAAGARLGESLYVVGGTDDQAQTDHLTNAAYAIDLRSGRTTRLPDYPEAGLITGTAAAARGMVCVFGGARWDAAAKGVVNHATAHAYLPREQRWQALPPLPYPVRGLAAVALDDRFILVAGGYRTAEIGFVTDALRFDAQTKTYAPAPPLPYAAMVTLVADGEWVYCLGGEDRMRHRTDAVYRIRKAELLPR